MRGLLAVGLVLLAAVAQVSISPLFPIGGAVADLPLVVLVALGAFSGAGPVMVAVPVVALLTGFATDRAPGLLLIGYIPLLPLGGWLDDARVPIGTTGRLFLPLVLTGAWARLVLATSAATHGADLQAAGLAGDVLVPGAVLDAALLAMVYVPARLLGWEPGRTSLRRGAY